MRDSARSEPAEETDEEKDELVPFDMYDIVRLEIGVPNAGHEMCHLRQL